jgi:hypothetical protein
MPYEVTTFTLPCGTGAVRADGSGVITGEDADVLMKKIMPGGVYFGQPLLVVTRQITRMTAEARKLFSRPNAPGVAQAWCGIVVTSPLIRVTVNFLMRVSGAAGSMKLFSSEPDAVAWMDERVRAHGPHMPAKT